MDPLLDLWSVAELLHSFSNGCNFVDGVQRTVRGGTFFALWVGSRNGYSLWRDDRCAVLPYLITILSTTVPVGYGLE